MKYIKQGGSVANYSILDKCVAVIFSPQREELAKQLLKALRKEGFNTFYFVEGNGPSFSCFFNDQTIFAGEDVYEVFNQAADRAQKVVLLFSDNFLRNGPRKRFFEHSILPYFFKAVPVVQNINELPVIIADIRPFFDTGPEGFENMFKSLLLVLKH